MQKFKFIYVLIIGVGLSVMQSNQSFCHTGHDHDAPKVIKASKGGVIKSIKSLSSIVVEVVVKGSSVRIYTFDNNMTPLKLADYTIEASASAPRSGKSDSVKLEAKDGYLAGNYNADGLHRYSLTINVTDLKSKKNGSVTFTIEPRK